MQRRVELDGLAQDTRVRVEATLPEPVAQDHRPVRGGIFLGLQEVATEGGLDAEHAEEVGGDDLADQALRLLAPGQVEAPAAVTGEIERLGLGAGVEQIGQGVREVHAAPGLVHSSCDYQPIRLGVGERAEHEDVHRAEDGRVGADADGQAEDGD